MNFSKEDTLSIKGVAILLMFYHHCFLYPDWYETFEISFFPLTENLANNIASFFKICVGMFTFLSGYGLTINVKKKYQTYNLSREQITDIIFDRYKNLMKGWLIVFFLANFICFCIDKRPLTIYGSGVSGFVRFILDMLCISDLIGSATLITTWWYMSMAVFLILLFPILISMYNSFGISIVFLSILLPKAFDISRTNTVWWLLAFVLGIVFADNNLLYKPPCPLAWHHHK